MKFEEKIITKDKKTYQNMLDYLDEASFDGEFIDGHYHYYLSLDKTAIIKKSYSELTLYLTEDVPSFIKKDLEEITKNKIEKISVKVN